MGLWTAAEEIKKLYFSVAVSWARVLVPSQRPLVPEYHVSRIINVIMG